MSHVAGFYRGPGQALIDGPKLTPAILRHLADERVLLEEVLRGRAYDAVVEVGCMDGRLHVEVALECGLEYLGIDLVAAAVGRFADRPRRRGIPELRARARVLDVARPADAEPDLPSGRVLAVFPFNSFGNIDRPDAGLRAVATCGLDLLILTYRTDHAANAMSRDYYARCGFRNLNVRSDGRGVLFRSAEGLHSYAEREPRLIRRAARLGYEALALPFGDHGLALLGSRRASIGNTAERGPFHQRRSLVW